MSLFSHIYFLKVNNKISLRENKGFKVRNISVTHTSEKSNSHDNIQEDKILFTIWYQYLTKTYKENEEDIKYINPFDYKMPMHKMIRDRILNRMD